MGNSITDFVQKFTEKENDIIIRQVY